MEAPGSSAHQGRTQWEPESIPEILRYLVSRISLLPPCHPKLGLPYGPFPVGTIQAKGASVLVRCLSREL